MNSWKLAFFNKNICSADWEAINVSSDEDIINSIAMGCPFDQVEKQALLEAQNIDERTEILLSLGLQVLMKIKT